MANPDDIRAMFFEECADLMEALFEGLALLECGEPEPDTVNAVFRAVHSIKGGAGAFKLDDLVHFSHKFETVLDALRSERIESTYKLVQTMLRAADHLSHLIEVSQSGGVLDADRGEALLTELDSYLGDDDEPLAEFSFQPMMLDFGAMDAPTEAPQDIPGPSADTLQLRFRPHAKLYRNGHDPLLLIEALRERAEVEVAIDLDAIVPLDALDPDAPSLVFQLAVTATDPERIVHDAFEFVDGLCDLVIVASDPLPAQDDRQEFVQEQADKGGKDMAFSAPNAAVSVSPLDEMLAPVTGAATSAAPEPSARAPAKAPSAPVRAKPQGGGDSAPGNATLRVDLDKVDRLINTVGELIINQAMIAQRIDQLNLPSDNTLQADMADYKILARELQEGVMSIRAQPVKPLFQRMARITREAGDATGKSVRLTMQGENTEVDKTVVERLADPLTHMIRNAVDHGLEGRDQRLAAGKPETGEIRLSARHKSGSVVIEVADDGAGLNRDKIFDIAVRKGLVAKNVELSDAEIDKLLFLPGFSTSTEVSKLSGRGVGMDVVKTAVQALGGRISIASTPGRGTVFTILLPLTLAVMDGIVISVAGETMIIPITAVIETLRPKPKEIHSLGPDEQLLMIRGEYVPIVDIRQKLGLLSGPPPSEQLTLVLVEGVDHNRCALCVDAVHDQRQVVIKAVGGNYGPIPGVSAATIMGNGRIALILDTDHLSHVERRLPASAVPAEATMGLSHE